MFKIGDLVSYQNNQGKLIPCRVMNVWPEKIVLSVSSYKWGPCWPFGMHFVATSDKVTARDGKKRPRVVED